MADDKVETVRFVEAVRFQELAWFVGLVRDFFTNDSSGHAIYLRAQAVAALGRAGLETMEEVRWPDRVPLNREIFESTPDLVNACKCALADLEGIMPEFEASGDRMHPGWVTVKKLRMVLRKAGVELGHDVLGVETEEEV